VLVSTSSIKLSVQIIFALLLVPAMAKTVSTKSTQVLIKEYYAEIHGQTLKEILTSAYGDEAYERMSPKFQKRFGNQKFELALSSVTTKQLKNKSEEVSLQLADSKIMLLREAQRIFINGRLIAKYNGDLERHLVAIEAALKSRRAVRLFEMLLPSAHAADDEWGIIAFIGGIAEWAWEQIPSSCPKPHTRILKMLKEGSSTIHEYGDVLLATCSAMKGSRCAHAIYDSTADTIVDQLNRMSCIKPGKEGYDEAQRLLKISATHNRSNVEAKIRGNWSAGTKHPVETVIVIAKSSCIGLLETIESQKLNSENSERIKSSCKYMQSSSESPQFQAVHFSIEKASSPRRESSGAN